MPTKGAPGTQVPVPALTADDPRHGTRYAYVLLRCRCDLCTEANRAYGRIAGARWRARHRTD